MREAKGKSPRTSIAGGRLQGWLSIGAAALLYAAFGCADNADPPATNQSETPSASAAVPPPVKYDAPAVQTTSCSPRSLKEGGGYAVKVSEMTCANAGEILKDFTTAFSDRNLSRTLVDRGHGWTCHQRLFGGGNSVEQICWRPQGQVLIFRK